MSAPTSIRFRDTPDGATFAVHVQPRARRSAIVGARGEALKVTVTAPPEDGRANEALIELLAETLGVKRRQIEILAGATSRDKLVRVRGIPSCQLAGKLAP